MTKSTPNEETMTFEAFLVSLATATMVSLGEMANPMTKKKEKDLPSARSHIDILELLSEKTKGNLTKEENDLLTQILHTVRLKYVESQSK